MSGKHLKSMRAWLGEKMRSDRFFLSFIVILNLIICAVLFKTLPFGDTAYYAHMTRVIIEDHAIFQQNFYSYFSILLSIVNIPAFLLLRNEFLSIRLTTLLIHMLIAPVFFLLFRRVLGRLVRPLSLLVLLNPLLIYFSGVYSWAEGLTTLISIIAFYFFFRRRGLSLSDVIFFSLFSGLAILARTAFILFIWPFCVYVIYEVLKDMFISSERLIRFRMPDMTGILKLASLALVILPYAFWSLIKGVLIVGEGDNATNYFSMVVDLMSANAGTVFDPSLILTSFFLLCSVGMFILFGPFFLSAFLRMRKPVMGKISVAFFAFLFVILFHSVWFVEGDFTFILRLRYLTPYVAVGLVAIGLKLKDSFSASGKGRGGYFGVFSLRTEKKFVWLSVVGSLIFFIGGSLVLAFPFIAAPLVELNPAGEDFIVLHSRALFDSVGWMNRNLPEGASVVVLMRGPQLYVGLDYFLPEVLRPDIGVYVRYPDRPDDYVPFGRMSRLRDAGNISGFYILSGSDLFSDGVSGWSSLVEIDSSGSMPHYRTYFYPGDIGEFLGSMDAS